MATSNRIPTAIEDELRSSYLEYAMSVMGRGRCKQIWARDYST